MRNYLILVLIIIGLSTSVSAQEEAMSNKLSMGFQLNQYQQDFGLGIQFTSPYFAHEHIAVRLRMNFMFNENIQDKLTTWTPYTNITLGMIGVGGKINNSIRLYGEGGLIGIIPSKDFSSESFVLGGYGLFGFEFYMFSKGAYFIEIGGVGSSATADKIIYQPIYSNGLSISTGFRFHL